MMAHPVHIAAACLCLLQAASASESDVNVPLQWHAPPPSAQPAEAQVFRWIIQDGARPADLAEWPTVTPDAEGWVSSTGSPTAVVAATVHLDQPRIMVLDARGHGATYVNGRACPGDLYATGYLHLPVAMQAGDNTLLFRADRGRVKAQLTIPPAEAFFIAGDATMPDGVAGQVLDAWLALPVVNATSSSVKHLAIRLHGPGMKTTETAVGMLPPLGVGKVPVALMSAGPMSADGVTLTLELLRKDKAGDAVLHMTTVTLEVVSPTAAHRRTFISAIDDSVQYYAVRPATETPSRRPGLAMTLHGAGVEAIGQLRAYGPKSWLTMIAPTNRRPYGFDWEDWGRLDALEVLQLAAKTYPHDPSRVYLTGHSMGGHGTWYIGMLHADRFAAVAPSAAWVSRGSYMGRAQPEPATPIHRMTQRVAHTGDPLAIITNLGQMGIYMLHGEADESVPVAQTRMMAEALGRFHRDWVYHEEPGVGHWWSNDLGDGGATCVDWPAMFDYCARRVLPEADMVQQVDFTTPSPGVSARCHWATIVQQQRHLEHSRIQLQRWPNRGRFVGTTQNVARLSLDVTSLEGRDAVAISLDGQSLEPVALPRRDGRVHLQRSDDGTWVVAESVDPAQKNPSRHGPIKDALRQRIVLVYGTAGTPEENRWAVERARLDSLMFWYRGNATLAMMSDADFDPAAARDRDVVLYGHARMNRAWAALLPDCPVKPEGDRIAVGDRVVTGDDLACLFVRPRPDSDSACVTVIAATGEPGRRLSHELRWAVPFHRYPDLYIASASAESLSGTPRVAGFFGNDWSVQRGEFAWDTVVPAPQAN